MFSLKINLPINKTGKNHKTPLSDAVNEIMKTVAFISSSKKEKRVHVVGKSKYPLKITLIGYFNIDTFTCLAKVQ